MPRALFLHQNAPAQFTSYIKVLGEQGWELVYVSEDGDIGKTKNIRIEHLRCSKPRNISTTLELQARCAIEFRSQMIKLQRQGWAPDIIFSHSGWGCGFYAKEIWPNTRLISYFEWIFNADSDLFNGDSDPCFSFTPLSRLKMVQRNGMILSELSHSSLIITPTRWQQCQIPKEYREKSIVLHEGIDTSYFMPEKRFLKADKKLITYTSRGFEPIRYFDLMVRATAEFLAIHREYTLVVAGQDKVFYGCTTKPKEGSFGKWARSHYSQAGVASQVIFSGRIPLANYLRLLQSSAIHIYLSRAFVASWGLLEAMSSGCAIVSNAGFPQSEFLNKENSIIANFNATDSERFKVKQIIDSIDIVNTMNPNDKDQMRLSARGSAMSFSRNNFESEFLRLISNFNV